MVRPLTRPSSSPATYYTFSSGTSMDILFAAHNSNSYPSIHASTYRTTLNLFASSTCGTTNAATATTTIGNGVGLMVVVVLALVGLLVC